MFRVLQANLFQSLLEPPHNSRWAETARLKQNTEILNKKSRSQASTINKRRWHESKDTTPPLFSRWHHRKDIPRFINLSSPVARTNRTAYPHTIPEFSLASTDRTVPCSSPHSF